jgi:5-hydroxyisourate hydrolase-like protein (transthyretin family)
VYDSARSAAYDRGRALSREDALALLALLLLLRCALDPNDFDYYHVPLLLAPYACTVYRGS